MIKAELNRRLEVSGTLLNLGLLIEAVCLLWARPLAFIVLVGLGGLLILAGILVYLYSLVSFKGPERITSPTD